ncbi:unnamed protein product [Scytosiphon promiscuus]
MQEAKSVAAISARQEILMTTSTPLPQSSPAGQQLWEVQERTSSTICRRSTPRRSVGTHVWERIGVSLLWISAQLSPVLTQSIAFEGAQPNVDKGLPAISEDTTCADWAAWIPRRPEPAVVMQVVSEGYIPIQQNFIRLMEMNSSLDRHNLFLMCLDHASETFFEERMGIRCVPISALHLRAHKHIWRLRVHVLSCLVRVGRVDVIMSDADALWIKDPINELFHTRGSGSDEDGSSRGGDHNGRMLSAVHQFGGSGGWLDVRDSDVVASRGSYPRNLGKEWGSTMCMGFILLRARNVVGMATFLRVVEDLVMETGDDQVSVNKAAVKLGIVWSEDSDMRYGQSTRYGIGKMPADSIAATIAAGFGGNSSGGLGLATVDRHEEVRPLTVTLLPQNMYTRLCDLTPVSNRTVVAHCHAAKVASVKTSWMESLDLWSTDVEP